MGIFWIESPEAFLPTSLNDEDAPVLGCVSTQGKMTAVSKGFGQMRLQVGLRKEITFCQIGGFPFAWDLSTGNLTFFLASSDKTAPNILPRPNFFIPAKL